MRLMRRLSPILIALLLCASSWAAASYAVLSGPVTATNGGTTDFTRSGFGTPTGALVFMTEANSTSNPELDYGSSWGFWDGTNMRSVTCGSEDNVGTSDAFRKASTDAVAQSQFGYAGTDYRATYSVSNVTDGVRLTMTVDSTTVQRYVTVVLFGGTASVNVGTLTPNGSNGGTASVTGLGYEPDLVFMASNAVGSTNVSAEIDNSFGVAVNDGSETQRGYFSYVENGADDSYTQRRLSTSYVCGQFYSGSLAWAAEVTAFNADGFTATTRVGATYGDVAYYMTVNLDGDSAHLRTLTTPTSTGSDSVTGLSFQPELALVFGPVTAVDTNLAHVNWAIGAADGTVEQSLSARDEDGVGTTDSDSKRHASVVGFLNPTDGSDDVIAALTSLNSDGRTYNFTTVNASARYAAELLIGSASTGTVTRRPSGAVGFLGL